MTRRYKKEENQLKHAIADYLLLQYPKVQFRMDWDHIRLTIGQAKQLKRLRSDFKFPDLFIAYPAYNYGGLWLEIKKSKHKIFKKNGELRNERHIVEQQQAINFLNTIGYWAGFVWDFDQAKKIIDWYLG